MKKSVSKVGFVAAALVSAGVLGCAHDSALDRKVDQDVAAQTNVKSRSDLQVSAAKSLDSANLTPEQREKLKTLRETTRQKVQALSQESLKLRAVLIKDLVSKNYNEDEVWLVKGRIKDVEQKRLATLFSAIESANTILGHESEGNRQIMEEFWMDPMNRND